MTRLIRLNDPKCLAVPVKENGEEMISLLDVDRVFLLSQTKVKSDNIRGDSQNPLVRKTVKEMLQRVLDNLEPEYGILLVESYREYEFQKSLFEKRVEDLMKDKNLSREVAEEKAIEFVSNPDIYSPHVTGGAIDIGIIFIDTKELLDVGNKFNYDQSAFSNFSELTEEQKLNREMLNRLMTNAGFVNYPMEWWHWSYGDKYWACMTGKPFAFYDCLKH
jgi:zinc D-Ala-D-Ala dipeptidase